jgi:hypothetical protein
MENGIGRFIVWIVVVALVVILFTYPLMLGINYLFAPSFLITLFGVPSLTFFKTWILLLVTSSLFGGYGSSSSNK